MSDDRENDVASTLFPWNHWVLSPAGPLGLLGYESINQSTLAPPATVRIFCDDYVSSNDRLLENMEADLLSRTTSINAVLYSTSAEPIWPYELLILTELLMIMVIQNISLLLLLKHNLLDGERKDLSTNCTILSFRSCRSR